jgi:competence protein ComEA
MLDSRIRWAMAGVIAVIACTGGASLYAKRHAPTPVTITNAPAATPGGVPDVLSAAPVKTLVNSGSSSALLPSDLVCYVHVAGAVRNPGLYHFALGSRIDAAIHAAGGGTNKADLDAVNLAEPLVDGEKVYVPERHEDPAQIRHYAPSNSIGHTAIRVAHASRIPTVPNLPTSINAIPPPVDASDVQPMNMAPTFPGSGSHAPRPAKVNTDSGERININTASETDLERLPGVGPATAARIIDFRQTNGGFRTLDDLRDVKGIGEKKLAKLAPFVTL